MSDQSPSEPESLDPVFANAKRETKVLLVTFLVFLVWSVGVSYYLGYGIDPEIIETRIFGMPRWVFWGVLVPWGVATLFTIWFAWFFMMNDSLDETSDGQSSRLNENQDHLA